MPRKIKYDASPTQEKFHLAEKFLVLLLGGKGSGKTYSLTMKGLQLAGSNKGINGGLLCPTLKMFKRDVLPTIKNICRANDIPYSFHKTDYVFKFPLSENELYVFHSEDDGESIAGANLGWGIINEVTLCSYLAYAEFISRMRLVCKQPQVGMSGTPEDLAWIDEEFFEKERDDLTTLSISTRENKHNSKQYIANLENTYDAQRQKAYIDGDRVLFNGRPAAWAFKQDYVKLKIFKPVEIWVSVDFNVSPMAGVIHYIASNDMPFTMYSRKEINIVNDGTTYKFCDVLKEYLIEMGVEHLPLYIYPDPAGKNRGTRSHLSDIQILEDELQGWHREKVQEWYDKGGERHGKSLDEVFDIRYKKKITSVKDCLNAMNNQFDKKQVFIHPDCKQFLIDLKKCKLLEDRFELDKDSDSKRTHWLDGFKDLCDYEFPIIKNAVAREI